MAQKEKFESDNLLSTDCSNDIIFSFGKSNNYPNNENKINKIILPINDRNNNYYHINDKDNNKIIKKNGYLIFNLLNRNKGQKIEKPLNYLSKRINQSNNSTKPKLDAVNQKYGSPKKHKQFNYYSNSKIPAKKNGQKKEKSKQIFKPKDNNLINKEKEEILKLFHIKNEILLTFPPCIKYLPSTRSRKACM